MDRETVAAVIAALATVARATEALGIVAPVIAGAVTEGQVIAVRATEARATEARATVAPVIAGAVTGK